MSKILQKSLLLNLVLNLSIASSFSMDTEKLTSRKTDADILLLSTGVTAAGTMCAVGNVGACAISSSGSVVVLLSLMNKLSHKNKEQLVMARPAAKKFLVNNEPSAILTSLILKIRKADVNNELENFDDKAIAALIVLGE